MLEKLTRAHVALFRHAGGTGDATPLLPAVFALEYTDRTGPCEQNRRVMGMDRHRPKMLARFGR